MGLDYCKENLFAQARDSLEIIRQSILLFESGFESFYRVTAVQLRMLLCDTTRRHGRIVDLSILPQITPGLRMHEMDSLGRLASDAANLSINQWLQQKLTINQSASLSIRQFIRQVCDQDGGAHYDPKRNRIFDKSPSYRQIVANLGRYLLDVAVPALSRLNPTEEEIS